MTTRDLRAARRIVVKLGSTTVVAPELEGLVLQMQALRERGHEVAVVTSGAVALGMASMGLSERPRELARKQALAAVGQADVMGRYKALFGRFGVPCAQILLTHEDISHRRHFLNIRHTLLETLAMGAVPIVNENDTVATEELRFGDNDRLAAALATVVDADLVVLLSDVDALCDADPRTTPGARPIHEVEAIDANVRAMAGSAGSQLGTGGMASKIEAAHLAVEAGIPLILARGSAPDVLTRLMAGELVGTRFHARPKRVGRRRHWIGFLSKVHGTVVVDAGAAEALRTRGSSLLPIGVTEARGPFSRGDAVSVVGPDGRELARGLVGYGHAELARIAGRRTAEAADILQVEGVDPVVHRNDMVLIEEGEGR